MVLNTPPPFPSAVFDPKVQLTTVGEPSVVDMPAPCWAPLPASRQLPTVGAEPLL